MVTVTAAATTVACADTVEPNHWPYPPEGLGPFICQESVYVPAAVGAVNCTLNVYCPPGCTELGSVSTVLDALRDPLW